MSHKKPITRRDFLSQGLLGTTTMVAMPSLLTMLAARRAFGADPCMATLAKVKTPFICIDLAGGSNIAGSNVIVGKQGGQMDFLTGYEKLGLPEGMSPRMTGQVNTELGLAFHSDSGFLRGIRSVTQATTRAQVDGIVLCTQSGDDTGGNPMNPMYWIAKSGLNGTLTSLAGTTSNPSGGNGSAPAMSINPAIRPIRLVNSNDARNLVSLGQLNVLFTPTKIDKIMGAIEKMSGSHLAAFQAKDLPTQIRELISCGYTKSRAVVQEGADGYDPLRDTLVQAVFPNIANNSEDQKVATIAKLVLDGAAGAGTITKGGYDYHSGNRADGERKDFEAGVAIGQCLELAARKGKDLMVYVFTDGGVSANTTVDNTADGRGKFAWTGDSGERGAGFILLYKARGGRPALRNNTRQIGHFIDGGQAVDSKGSLIATNVENQAKAVVLNYMALDGSETLFRDVIGGTDPFLGVTDKYLLFSRLA
jgi:hypothetical protein